MDTYKTISKESTGIYKDKGSKFLSFAFPVTNVEDVAPIVNSLKKEYFDARHHCFAWRLGVDGSRFRVVDDGEPSSTAGRPILGQIQSFGLTDILIVVIRYFGGTLLGVPGLIKAYKAAAEDAIKAAEIVEKFAETFINITFSYFVMNDVMKIIKDLSPNVLSQEFDNDCVMHLSIRQSMGEELSNRLSKVEGLQLDLA